MSNYLGIAINISLAMLVFNLLWKSNVQAQIIPDDSLKEENSVIENVNINGKPSDLIEGGARRGENLFHSFEKFNVGEGQQVYFKSPAGIENILSRVTGGELSEILGTLGVADNDNLAGNANLFLINPNGIIFGNNSALDLGGSFIATTASSVIFENNIQFSTKNPSSPPLLTVSVPIGLQFGEIAGSIINKSMARNNDKLIVGLQISSGKTLALVGRNIIVQEGRLTVPGGRIELGSVSENSKVGIQSSTDLTFSYKEVQNFQDITLTSVVNVIDFINQEGGGAIDIQGRNVTIANGSQVLGSGAKVTVTASEILKLTGTALDGTPSILFNETAIDDNEGNIKINTERLIIRDGGRISTQSSGGTLDEKLIITKGTGGNLNVNATESLDISGNGSGLFSTTLATGNAGNLDISTKRLILEDGAKILAESAGENFLGEPLATGEGGDINIIASESINLDDSLISAETIGLGGNAGNLRLITKQLNVQNEAQISVSATGLGEAGNIDIDARDITLDRGTLSAKTRTGDRGNITIDNTETLLLRDNSQITTDAAARATGGNITINAEAIAALNNSDIVATAELGEGGEISIGTKGLIGIAERSSTPPNNTSDIDASSEFGLDGTITIYNPDVNPTSGVVELPNVPIDAETILAQDVCKLENDRIAGGSSFIITGRGGLSSTSAEPLDNRDVVGWASRDDLEVSNNGLVGVRQREPQTTSAIYPEIQQSQGWVTTADGSVWLVANAPNYNLQSLGIDHPSCRTKEKT